MCLRRLLSTFQTNCGDCDPLEWMTPSNNVRMDPPQNTVALVVDVRGSQGAIRIANTQDNKYADEVGPVKEAGNLVMVTWKSNWWYYTIGSVRVAYIRRSS